MGKLDGTGAAMIASALGIRTARRIAASFVVAAIAVVASGHVGSPDTWFEGNAGPYPVRIVVRSPGVVPGLSDVTIRVMGEGVSRVTAVPVQAGAAKDAVPPPDVATPVPGDAELYSVQLWLMAVGAYSINVTVEGTQGAGAVSVPVTAIATRRLEMQWPLGMILIGLGVALIAGLLTLIGAAVRESVLPPGAVPDRRLKNRARGFMAGTGVLLTALLFGGWTWWQAEDANFSRYLNWTFTSETTIKQVGPDQVLTLAITDSVWLMRDDATWLRRNGWGRLSPLIPDHGKLMHMFVVRDDKQAFAHLHPVPQDSTAFMVTLPSLPSGNYRVYGDIVRENGMTHTLVSNVVIPPSGDPSTTEQRVAAAPDPDDAGWVSGEVGTRFDQSTIRLSDGSTMTWVLSKKQLIADEEADLQFTVSAPDGSAASLEPYMGMISHAMIASTDDSVFVHLHPTGSTSMGTQKVIEMSLPTDTISGMLGQRITQTDMSAMNHNMGALAQNTVRFPYAFPSAGKYRIWVQVKRAGTVLTGAFDTDVQPTQPASGRD